MLTNDLYFFRSNLANNIVNEISTCWHLMILSMTRVINLRTQTYIMDYNLIYTNTYVQIIYTQYNTIETEK